MALDLDCATTEYYTGDGSQRDFTYSFEILQTADLHVGIYNTTTNEYDEFNDWIFGATNSVVRFLTAPSAGAGIVIYRLTDIDPMKAIFNPGHAVRAVDLNDNFEQLQFAVEESRCLLEGQQDTFDNRYWQKLNNTIYSSDTWVAADDKVGSTKAIDDEIQVKIADLSTTIDGGLNIIRDDITDIQDDITDLQTNTPTITTTAPLSQTVSANNAYSLAFDISALSPFSGLP
jgi:hypothetical protein|tara:strand:+ start:3637 stop:4329 length:693 start_codon:yes stop_codon:yes gene_type:complete